MALERAASADVADRLFARRGAALALLRAAWPHAVGRELARRSEPVAIERGVLRVRVADARWRASLQRLRAEILSRLRRVAGPLAPGRLGFVEGPVAGATGPRSEPVPRRPDAGPVAAAPEVEASAASIADPEVRRLFLESAGRYLARVRRATNPSEESSRDA